MTPNEFISRFEKLCMLKPDVPTGALMVELFGDWREEIDKVTFGALAMQKQAQEERLANMRFALALRGTQTSYGYLLKDDWRLTEDELKKFASTHELEYSKLLQVVLGQRESYKGYVQGPFYPGSTFGKKFEKINTDKFPGEDKPVPEKVGVRGMFKLVKKTNEDE
jgi:hypothetical protein